MIFRRQQLAQESFFRVGVSILLASAIFSLLPVPTIWNFALLLSDGAKDRAFIRSWIPFNCAYFLFLLLFCAISQYHLPSPQEKAGKAVFCGALFGYLAGLLALPSSYLLMPHGLDYFRSYVQISLLGLLDVIGNKVFDVFFLDFSALNPYFR